MDRADMTPVAARATAAWKAGTGTRVGPDTMRAAAACELLDE